MFIYSRKFLLFLLVGLLLATFLGIQPPSAEAALPYPSNCTAQTGTVYDVGPAFPFTSIGAVPFNTLGPGDLVRIHWRATPYHEKIAISTSGTPANHICIVGVPGPGGEMPIIDGQNATTSPNMFYDFDGRQQRGLLTIMGQDWPEQPEYINIEGLHLRNAYSAFTFTTASGQVRNYTANAAAIDIQRGKHIRITGVILSDSGNGLFAATTDHPEEVTEDLILEYSHIYGNGTAASDQQHNVYTESIGMIYQFNRFGPLRANSGGNNIKDRSSGTIIRYNWIDSGAHLIDLVEAEDGYPLLSQRPDYNQAWIYGNVMLNRPGSSTSNGLVRNGRNTVHFGGDLGGETNGASSVCGFGGGQDPTECYRKGPLYFYNNTVIFYVGSGEKALLRLQTDEQVAQVFNNIIHVIGSGDNIHYMNRRGVANLGVNLVNTNGNGLTDFYSQDGPASAVTGQANVILLPPGNTGFVNAAAEDFYLVAGTLPVDAGQGLPGGARPVDFEFNAVTGSQARNITGQIDLGAFENASAVLAPEINVTQGATAIQVNNSFDFGSIIQGGSSLFVFTVQNNGTADLNLTSSPSLPAGFILNSDFGVTTLAPNQSTSFEVGCDTSTPANYSGTLSFANTDLNENPFSFTITCNVLAPTPPTLQVSPANLAYDVISGGGNPAPQSVTMSNAASATGSFDWSLAVDQAWLNCQPATGVAISPGGSTLADCSVDVTLLPAGLTTYTALITVTSPTPSVVGSPQTIPVTVNIIPPDGTPIPPVGTPALPGIQGTSGETGSGGTVPSPTLEFISKSVDKTLAAIGDTLTYTIVFSNPKGIALQQVVITDTLDARLENIRVLSNSMGTAIVTGTTVTVQGFTLLPGQRATLVIVATLSNRVRPSDKITNTASLESPNASIHVSNAVETMILPGALPTTGEHRDMRLLLIIALGTSLCLGGIMSQIWRRFSLKSH